MKAVPVGARNVVGRSVNGKDQCSDMDDVRWLCGEW